MSDRPLNVGMIGYGHYMRSTLVRVFRQCDSINIIGVYNRGQERRDHAAADGFWVTGDLDELLGRADVEAVVVGTHNQVHHDHAIAAARAGKHIFCEKPMTRFIAEGRAVSDAVRKAGVTFQIGTFGRYGNAKNRSHIDNHKIIRHGLVKDLSGIYTTTGAKNRTGRTDLIEQEVPSSLDYDMWLGPAPYKPYNSARVHYSNRFYWDYEGGDLTNFGAHSYDPFQWSFAKDETAPVKAVPSAPWPQHPDAVGQYGWVELTYADGLKVVVTGGSWRDGPGYETSATRRMLSAGDLDEAGRKKLAELPDPEPMLTFGDAVRQGKPSGGQAESSHRVCTALHLANIAIRMGRTIHFDPVTEQIVGDEQADRMVNIPMRAPWHL